MYKRVFNYYNLEAENGIDCECEEYRKNGLLGPWVFRDLPSGMEFAASAKKHNINYKEQIWDIPSRDIVYKMELIRDIKQNIAIASITHAFSDESKIKMYRELAESGVMRYYRVVTEENVLGCIKELGFVSIYSKDNGFSKDSICYNLYLNEGNINKGYLDPKKIKKAISGLMRESIVNIK